VVTTQSSLLLLVYAPALVRDDGRPLAVVRGMERALPGLRLEWTISDEGQLTPLPRRDAWVTQGRPDGPGFPLVCNGERGHLVTLYGLEIPAGLGPGGQPLFDIHAELPLTAADIAVATDALEGIAESAHAFWGHATPDGATLDIALQTAPTPEGPPSPPRGLPALQLAEALRSPEVPHCLGWLNYWSADTARTLGFPDPARDAELLSRSRRTASGGWIVRLTEAPLDLDSPAHLDALLRAYERFPEIGGRQGS
jgi:hypothetical protein